MEYLEVESVRQYRLSVPSDAWSRPLVITDVRVSVLVALFSIFFVPFEWTRSC